MTDKQKPRSVTPCPIVIEEHNATAESNSDVKYSGWVSPGQKELRDCYPSTAAALAAIGKHADAGTYRIISIKRASVTVATEQKQVRTVT